MSTGSDSPGGYPVDEDTEMQDADAVNGHADTESENTPIPPPHKVQSPPPKPAIDPEVCKATGNKYFKAKDYPKAIAEYTKGKRLSSAIVLVPYGDDYG